MWTDKSRTIFKHSHLSEQQIALMQDALKADPTTTTVKLAKIGQVTQKTAWAFKRRILEGPEVIRGYGHGKYKKIGKRRTVRECAGLDGNTC